MKKKIIFIAFILVVFGVGMILYLNRSITNKEIYNTIYYFSFGSRRVKIYENGDVYDDLELEDSDHENNYEFVKKLTGKQLSILKEKIAGDYDVDEINNYIIVEVYGVEKFGNMGEY